MEKFVREPRAAYIMIMLVAVSIVVFPLSILDFGERDTFSVVCATICFAIGIFVIILLVWRLKRRTW